MSANKRLYEAIVKELGKDSQWAELADKWKAQEFTPHGFLLSGGYKDGQYEMGAALIEEVLGLPTTRPDADVHLYPDTGTTLSIEEVSHLRDELAHYPQGNFHVVLIENTERMSTEAVNAFLKTLEEPPSKTLFLLTSSRASELIPTLLSRVQKLTLPPVPEDFLKNLVALSTCKEKEQLQKISGGKLGILMQLMEADSLEECALYQDFASTFWKHRETTTERYFRLSELLLKESTHTPLLLYYLEKELLEYSFPLEQKERFHKALLLLKKDVENNVNKKLAMLYFVLSCLPIS